MRRLESFSRFFVERLGTLLGSESRSMGSCESRSERPFLRAEAQTSPKARCWRRWLPLGADLAVVLRHVANTPSYASHTELRSGA